MTLSIKKNAFFSKVYTVHDMSKFGHKSGRSSALLGA
jgi:hypothetical protein